MLRPKKMFKVTALGLQKEKEFFCSTIHKLGCLHIDNVSVKRSVKPDVPLPETEEISQLLLRVNFLKEVLKSNHKVASPIINDFNLLNVVREVRASLGFEREVVNTHNELSRINDAIVSKQQELELLKRFALFDLSGFANSQNVVVLFGRVLKSDFKPNFSASIKRLSIVNTFELSESTLGLIVVYHKKVDDELQRVLKLLNVEREKVNINTTPAILSAEIVDLSRAKKALETSLVTLSYKYYEEVVYLHKLLSVAKSRCEVALNFGRTNNTFLVDAFIPVNNIDVLQKSLEDKNIVLLSIKPDDAPVLLPSVPYVNSFRHITTMFGFPKYSAFDPTLFVSIFFPFFFGFMLSDTGYGIILLLACLPLLFMKKPLLKDVGIIGVASSISTILFGVAFGSFFGSLIVIPALWIDPFKDSMTILKVAIGIGFVHVNLGILLSVITGILNRDWKATIVNNGALLFLQAAVLFFVLGNSSAGYSLLLVSLGFFFVKSGLFGIMEVSGFAGVILSYARILALTLATGGIALAVNIIGKQILEIGWLGLILSPLIIVIGHIINLGLNIIGSTVNSARLHFVEFFSLFFIEGGEEFKPFKIDEEE